MASAALFPRGNAKRTLYVGGLDEAVDPDTLKAAFVPFGDIKNVQIPLDPTTGKHKGFGFVEFYEDEDAQHACENMHESELYGRTLRVNMARGMGPGGEQVDKTKPVWADDFLTSAAS